MEILILILAVIIILFGFVVFLGAPYLPTLKNQRLEAIKMLGMKPGQTLLEPGSGDGRMLKTAAQAGIKAYGYEVNPLLYLVSIIVTWRYRKLVTIKLADYWLAKWPPCDGIYVFLRERYMKKLDKKIIQEYGNKIKVVSFGFKIPNRRETKKASGLYYYEY